MKPIRRLIRLRHARHNAMNVLVPEFREQCSIQPRAKPTTYRLGMTGDADLDSRVIRGPRTMATARRAPEHHAVQLGHNDSITLPIIVFVEPPVGWPP